VGVIDQKVAKHWDIDQQVLWLELDLTLLADVAPITRSAMPISRYPATDRDLTVIVDQQMAVAQLMDHLKDQAAGSQNDLVEAIDLLDIFAEDPIPEGKKSVTLRLTYRSFEGTLKDEAINVMHAAITQKLVEAFGADLPA
jgi:phenylalanyl-tRNA synthetase beta chain